MCRQQSECRDLFLANYAKAHAKAVQRRHDMVSGVMFYRTNSLRALHRDADRTHAKAVQDAARLTDEQLERGGDHLAVVGHVDVEAIAEVFAMRTAVMDDHEQRQRVEDMAAPYIGE
ncbi:MAG: hypothetical protein Q4B54_08855 [Coriobacteriales bacterium]|nr:hypothetical protein [Coriobacteriales bacterium]